MRTLRLLVAGILLVCPPLAAHAAPTVGVTPSSLDRFDPDAVELTVTGLVGAEVRLRLFTDANGNGLIDAEDWLVWADLVPDNAAGWSPAMAADTDPAAGAIAVDVRLFGPLGFPRTPGSYVWQAEDPADASTDSVAFAVTQLPEPQRVSGQVTDETLAPLAGALVVLLPVSEDCDEPELSVLADAAGNWSLEVPDDLPCQYRIALGLRPGYVTSLSEGVPLFLVGTGSQTGVVLTTRAGAHPVDGTLRYAGGPRDTEGIPGNVVFVESDSSEFAFAGSDVDGSFDLMLGDGTWFAQADDEMLLALQGAVRVEGAGEGFVVAGGPATIPDLIAPAANAFVRGVLRDDTSAGRGGREVSAESVFPCGPDCYRTETITAPDGSFVLGLVAPPGPDTAAYDVEPLLPLPGLVATTIQVSLSAGDDLAGQDLDHLAPTSFIVGTITDLAGNPVPDLCLWGETFGTPSYVSRARSDCDGTYVLPVVDEDWFVGYEEEELVGFVRGVDVTAFYESISVTGQDQELDLILGPFALRPAIRRVEPGSGRAGDHVVLEGANFGDAPAVSIGGLPAAVVASRPDIGRVVVEVPGGLPAGAGASVTITNPESGLGDFGQCMAIDAGAFTPTCSIDGTVTVGGSPVPGTLVVALDEATEAPRRVAVTDGSGVYSMDLDAAGPYALIFIPPVSNPRQIGEMGGVPCPATQDHALRTGRRVSGRVVDFSGRGIPNVRVLGEGEDSAAEAITNENGGYSVRVGFEDTVTFEFEPPPGSRWLAGSFGPVFVDGALDLPPVTLDSGRLFAGRAIDLDGAPLAAAVRSRGRFTGTTSGIAVANACDGSFAVGVGPGEHELRLEAPGPREARVAWVETLGDERAEFDFTLFDDAAIQLTGPEPRIGDDAPVSGRVGELLLFDAENLAPTGVSVLFAAAGGGFVPGDDTAWDVVRGIVVTRVPAAAESGGMVLDVGGMSSEPFLFTVDPEPFDPGTLTLDGQVVDGGGLPVEGAIVALLLFTPDPLFCEGEDEVHDFAVTDSTGSYALQHPGGDVALAVLPPRVGPVTDLAPAVSLFPGLTSDLTFMFTLETGLPITLRAVAGTPPAPVAGARIVTEGMAFDQARTDAAGEATLYTPSGAGADVLLELAGPVGSRLFETGVPVTAPAALGDVLLDAGLFVSGRVIDFRDSPEEGAFVAGFSRGPGPFERYFESTARANGLWRGPVPVGAVYGVTIESERDDDLARAEISEENAIDVDTIRHPSVVLGPAGFIAGTVRDGGSGLPLPGAGLAAQFEMAGFPGETAGFGESCDDGGYLMKVSAGTHFVGAFLGAAGMGGYFEGWYSPATPGDACFDDAETVSVGVGQTVAGIDIELDPPASISGTVLSYDVAEPGVGVEVSLGRFGSCLAFGVTDGSGFYEVSVPAGAGYRVEAQAPPSVGGPSQCWDGVPDCAGFTAVDTMPFSTTGGIDFVFGFAPSEVSGGAVQLTVERGVGDAVTLTFEARPPEERVDGYNAYGGVLGVFDSATGAECFIPQGLLMDNGDGTLSYDLLPPMGAEWFLVGASNPVGESSLGDGRSLSNACGAN